MDGVICPACGSSDVRLSKLLEVDEVATHLCPPARDADRFERMKRVLARSWKSDHVEVVVCSTCRLGFTNPLVEGDHEFYSILHERVGYPADRWEFGRARKFLAGLNRAARILDVGAGAGDFLASVDSKHDRQAIEASETLRELLKSKSIKAMGRIDESSDRFDLITMFHVIQYFSDPVAMLMKIRDLIGADGRMMLSVPNADAVGSPDDLVSPPHPLTRWNQLALTKAFERAGLRIESIEYIAQPLSSLMWAAHGRTRASITKNPHGISARVDGLKPGTLRSILLKPLGLIHLPWVLMSARSRIYRSQILVVAGPRVG